MVVDEAQQDEKQGALDQLDVEGALVRGGLRLGQEREGDGHPGDEHEQGEDEVVEVEAGPFDVLELDRPGAGPAPVRHFGQGPEEGVAADDPEHVETAQGVEREQALCRPGRSSPCHFSSRLKSRRAEAAPPLASRA